MLRAIVSPMLAAAMLLASIGPAFAQEQSPDAPELPQRLYLPSIVGAGSVQASDDYDDSSAPITSVTVDESSVTSLGAAASAARPLPSWLAPTRLETPLTATLAELGRLKISPDVPEAGAHNVIIRLSEPSVGETIAAAAVRGAAVSSTEQVAQASAVEQQQAQVLAELGQVAPDAVVLGTTQATINAILANTTLDALEQLASNPAVVAIRPVKNYEKDLTETVPYIGATTVREAFGFDGTGVKVAVLDSGIDYTHLKLGGSGVITDFVENDPTIIEPGTFPTSKVVGGYDFVGSQWASGADPVLPDPDPIDDGPGRGHGTHVADIIAGLAPEDPALGGAGVAPGASLYAVKVCSSISTSCSGVALINAMEYVVDPNGDGDTGDHLDIVNMSLGSPYGQSFDDDLSQAVDSASAAGVLTVASSGNSSDKPYVTGTPGAAPTALSVAQTSVPSGFLPLLRVLAPESAAGQYQAVFQPWSAPLTAAVEAPMQYGDGAGGNLLGCNAFPAGSLAGRIVLVDRGSCGFSIKISNIAAGGGLIGIIGLVAPGEPFEGGFGGGAPTVPGYMISQVDANRIKRGLAAGVTARIDPAFGISLVRHMVGSSSRGPSMGDNLVKPEIGAPGASVSAVAGSGTGLVAFGGTSGAAPMVAGSAALLKQAYPDRTIMQLKAALVNTAETNIINKAAIGGGPLAAITRIGGGEVRVDQALVTPLVAYEAETGAPALSFAFNEVSPASYTLSKWVAVRNYSNTAVHLRVSSAFRVASDEANGAVRVRVPDAVEIPANDWGYFEVKLEIAGARLNDWALDSGLLGASGDALTAMEYDGLLYMTDMSDGANRIHLPWHVLPRKAANITLRSLGGADVRVRNRGVATATVESYSLIAANYNLPEGGSGEQNPRPDFHYLGYATYPVPAGFCSDSAMPSFLLSFAVNTWERQTHANAPLSIEVNLDVDRDGAYDYQVYTLDAAGLSLSDGRNLTWVANLRTGVATAFFGTDHRTNSGNTVLTLCAEQIDMDADNFLQPINVKAAARDIYFTGAVTDSFEGITIAPLGERYLGDFANGELGATQIGYRQNDVMSIYDTGSRTNNTEFGLILLYRPGAPENAEAGVVIVR